MYSSTLKRRARSCRGGTHRCFGSAENVPKRLFIWICGQKSAGRKRKCQGKKKMAGNEASAQGEERTKFWAVATPR